MTYTITREELRKKQLRKDMAELMMLVTPELKIDPDHLDVDDEDFKEIQRSLIFKAFMFHKACKQLFASIKRSLKLK